MTLSEQQIHSQRLRAGQTSNSAPPLNFVTPMQLKGKKTMFRIRIDADGNNGDGKAKVNVNIPISVAKKLSSLTKVIPASAKSEMEKEGFNIDELNLKELIEAIENGDIDEEIVNIDATGEEGGAKVKIYVD